MNRKEVIQHLAHLAGGIVRNAMPSEGIVAKEGRANFVTAADMASEKAIMEGIRSDFPEDRILSEETPSDIQDPLKAERLWVIDPIDGTSNFRYGRNYCAVSIGYIERGIIQMGAVYDPFRDELFYAEKGKGAFLNGRRIKVNDLSDLSKATIATDNSYNPEGTRHHLELVLKIKSTPWVLMKGSAVLAICEVAAGRIDLYFNNYLKPWDNAAALIIAEEAGATIKNIGGQEINFLSASVVVGNNKLVTQFVSETLGV